MNEFYAVCEAEDCTSQWEVSRKGVLLCCECDAKLRPETATLKLTEQEARELHHPEARRGCATEGCENDIAVTYVDENSTVSERCGPCAKRLDADHGLRIKLGAVEVSLLEAKEERDVYKRRFDNAAKERDELQVSYVKQIGATEVLTKDIDALQRHRDKLLASGNKVAAESITLNEHIQELAGKYVEAIAETFPSAREGKRGPEHIGELVKKEVDRIRRRLRAYRTLCDGLSAVLLAELQEIAED